MSHRANTTVFLWFSYGILHFLWTVTYSMANECTIKYETIRCKTDFPHNLPDGINQVFIEDYRKDEISNQSFLQENWMSVHSLDINVNHELSLGLDDNSFDNLNSLSSLGIHTATLQFAETYVFETLHKLEVLDLSSCYQANTSDLLTTLENSQLTLKILSLDQFSISGGDKSIYLNDKFLQMLSSKKVEQLRLSGTNIVFAGPYNVSKLIFPLFSLDISNVTISTTSDTTIFDVLQLAYNVFAYIRNLNISNMPERLVSLDSSIFHDKQFIANCLGSGDTVFTFGTFIQVNFLLLEYMTMNSYVPTPLVINNASADLRHCDVRLKLWHINSNKIHYFNATILWPETIELSDLDMSSNSMEYLSPFSFGTVKSLEIFNISNNNLYWMEHFPEFSQLMETFVNLKVLDMSNNSLSYIPEEMFDNNVNLFKLDLSYNNLNSVTFHLEQLTSLRILSLRNNQIKYLNEFIFGQLNGLLTTASEGNGTKVKKELLIDENPFVCNCDSVSFIRWVTSTVGPYQNKTFECTLEGTGVEMNNDAVKRSKFLCIRTKVIIGSVFAALFVCSIVVVTVVGVMIRKKRRRQRKNKDNFLENFRNGNTEEKFMCFLSFSSYDEGQIINDIYKQLNVTLTETTGIDNHELVCLGDRHFNPGFPIVEEILRCISESCVILFIVTQQFCDSHWCQMEIREAYDLGKPIILMFKEEVNETNMSPLMLKVFNNYTRVKVNVENDHHEVIPSYEKLCQSIVLLATARYEEMNKFPQV